MRRSERAGVIESCGAWKSLTFIVLITTCFIIHPADSNPINRQVGISENVFITVQNDTYGNEQRVCSIDSVTYTDGESIPTASPCEHCICRPPGFACTIISCEYRPGCKALKRSNQCCPEYQCECEKDGKIYQNGEKILDNNNPCEVCYCQGGDVICAVIDCYWRSDCQPRYIENRCCPLYDHCPPNQPGSMRPTQRPLTTTTTGTTVGWFNLSSSIFASSSTPFAQLEDLSSTTAASVTTTAGVHVPSTPQEESPVSQSQQELENTILPSQVPAVPIEEKLSESHSPIVDSVQASVEETPINLIPASSSKLPIPSTEQEQVHVSSESPVEIPESIVTVESAPSSSTNNPIQSLVQESSSQVPEVSLSSSQSPPLVVEDAPPPPQEDASTQIIDDVNLSSSPIVAPTPVPTPVESSEPSTTVISNIVPVIIVATPVEAIHSVKETSVPDLSSSVEQLPVSPVHSSLSSSVTVTNLEDATLTDSTQVLETITVVNTLDAPSSIVVEPTLTQEINPTTILSSVVPSVVLPPSSNLVVDAPADQPELQSATETVVEDQADSVTELPSAQEIPSVAPPPSLPVINEKEVPVDSSENQVTTQIPEISSSTSSGHIVPPSLELLPPIHPVVDKTENVVQDDKPIEIPVVAPPSIELQPPAQDEAISPVISSQTELPVVEVQTVAPIVEQEPELPSSDLATVVEVESTSLPEIVIESSQPPQVVNDDKPVQIVDEEKTTDFPVQNDPVTEIPTLRPDSSSSSSSSEVPVNDEKIIQDVPAQPIIDTTEPATNAPIVVQDDSQSGVVSDEPVIEVTDSAPVFVETSDTLKATQQDESSINEANLPTSSPVVSDDVTEVVVDMVHSSTVPQSESSVSVSFSDVNDANAVTATGDQLDSQDQSDPTSDNENNLPVDVVATTTQKIHGENVGHVSDALDSSVEETVPMTTIPSIVNVEASPSKIHDETEGIVNDEPETTVASVQSDDGVVVDEEKIEATTFISKKKEEVSSLDFGVLSDESQASSVPSQVEPEVESNVKQEEKKPSINEEPVVTTTSNIVSSDEVQFDESPSQKDETTIKSSIVEDPVQNDEPQAQPVTLTPPGLVSDVKNDAVEEISTTLKPEINEISLDSSESKFRLDPSVFNKIPLTSSKEEAAGKIHASLHHQTNDENSATTIGLSENEASFDNVPTHSPQVKSELNNKLNDVQNIVADEAEQGVTTEENRKIVQSVQDKVDDGEGIELTTAGSTLGDERKDLELEESTSIESVPQRREQVKNTQGVDSVTSSQNDEKVEGEDQVLTTLATLFLRHHSPDHQGLVVDVDETTRIPQQNDEIPQNDNLVNLHTQEAATTDNSQDEPVGATTIISLKHDFRSGLDSAEIQKSSESSPINLNSSTSESINFETTHEPLVVKHDEPLVDVTTVTTDNFDLPESTNLPVKTGVNDIQHDDTDTQHVAGTTVVSDQNDDVILTTAATIKQQDNIIPVISQNENEIESKVNETNHVKTNYDHIVIPSELVKRLDPITDDLGQNARSDLSLQSQMKDEIGSADETWFWRVANRIRNLPVFSTVLTRQPRSVPSTKPELFKPNKTKKATAQRKKYVPQHRPFLFW